MWADSGQVLGFLPRLMMVLKDSPPLERRCISPITPARLRARIDPVTPRLHIVATLEASTEICGSIDLPVLSI